MTVPPCLDTGPDHVEPAAAAGGRGQGPGPAAKEPPPALVEQLAPGGRMVVPLGGDDVQQLTLLIKDGDGTLSSRSIMPVRFTQLETMG